MFDTITFIAYLISSVAHPQKSASSEEQKWNDPLNWHNRNGHTRYLSAERPMPSHSWDISEA